MIEGTKYVHVLPGRHLTKDSGCDCYNRTKDLHRLLIDRSTVIADGETGHM